MIYTQDTDGLSIAIPETSVLRIKKDEKTVTNKKGDEREVDVYYIEYVGGGSMMTRFEPTEKKVMSLPQGIEVWSPYEDEGNIYWDISKTINGIYSVGIFTNTTTLEVAVTDLCESEESYKTMLVDRNSNRARVNSFETSWSNDLLDVMSELMRKKVVLAEEFVWQNSEQQTPKTKAAAA